MIKFEEHEGMLFRMLDKPVPLTPDAEMPCLVRLIQDDSPMGKYNKDVFGYDPERLTPRICTEVIDVNDLSDHNRGSARCDGLISIQYYHYELIGSPVVEGSPEWALYQMMHGKWVYNPSLEKHKSDKLDTRYLHAYGKFGQDIIVKNTLTGIDSILGAANISHWTNYAEPSGWQIYKEPKPLLAEAKVGDLVKLRNGSYSQIIEVKDNSVFKYQNPEVIGSVALFWCDENGDTSRWGKLKDIDIIFTEPLAPEGTAEWAWQMAKLGIETRCYKGKIRVAKSGLIEVCYNGMAYAMPLTQSAENRQYVINKIRECSPDGWQIYHEPEQPKPKFKIGDSVICEYHRSPLPKQVSYERVIDVDEVTIVTQSQNGSVCAYDINGNHGDINGWHIDRVISPSEHIVTIGCLSGTVAPVSNNGIHLWFHLVGINRKTIATIRIDSLNTHTRELVESLLKAMRGDA